MNQPTLQDLLLKKLRCFHIRITTKEIDIRQSEKMLESFTHYIIAQEGDGIQVQRHQHILVGISDLNLISKPILKKLLVDTYNVKGNKEHQITIVKDKKSMASYVVKEQQEIAFKGFTKEQINTFIKKSYQKDEFTKKYQELQELLDDKAIGLGDYSDRLFSLKANCNQPVCMRSHQNHIMSKAIKLGHIQKSQLTKKVFINIGLIEWMDDCSDFYLFSGKENECQPEKRYIEKGKQLKRQEELQTSQ